MRMDIAAAVEHVRVAFVASAVACDELLGLAAAYASAWVDALHGAAEVYVAATDITVAWT